MKPSRFEIERPRRSLRLVVPLRERGEQIEARHAERMDHAVRPAGEHHVDLAAADHLGRLADGLAARGTRGEAVHVRTLRIEPRRQIRGRHVRLLFELQLRIEPLEPFADERAQVEVAILERGDHHPAEVRKVLLPFAGAEIHAEPLRLDARRARPTPRSPASPHRGQTSCAARASPTSPRPRRRRPPTSSSPRPRSAWENCWRRTASSARRPTSPPSRLAHNSGTVVPSGVTQPTPVTTTRRRMSHFLPIRISPRRTKSRILSELHCMRFRNAIAIRKLPCNLDSRIRVLCGELYD